MDRLGSYSRSVLTIANHANSTSSHFGAVEAMGLTPELLVSSNQF